MMFFKRSCDKCKNLKAAKSLKTIQDFFAILEELEKLSATDNFEYAGGNAPADTIKNWPQDGLWYRIKCKNCDAIYTLWYDVFNNKGCFKKGK
jgi:hypothetical protein